MKKTSLDVIKTFYIADELLPTVFKKKYPYSEKSLRKTLERLIKKADKIPKNFFLRFQFSGHNSRYDHYFNSKWTTKTILLKDIGLWPRAGWFSDKVTKGNVLEATHHIEKILLGKKNTKEYKRALYIKNMTQYVAIINEYVPIIVLEDHVIRHELLISKDQRKMYKKCTYDVDDGNHRAIALALSGETKVKAFVGKRVYKNPLLYGTS